MTSLINGMFLAQSSGMRELLGRPRLVHSTAIFACLSFATPYSLLAQAPAADRAVEQKTPQNVSSPPGQPAFVPMTESQRLREFFKDTVSPPSFVTSAANAGIGQARDRPEEWKQGGEGYGLRFASSFGTHIVRATLQFGASSLLHEDNRYIPSGQTGAKARIGYAVESTFLARRDDGSRRLSYSRIGAFAGAALISRLWQPDSTRTGRSAAINFGITMGVAAGFNVAREFLPRVFHWI
jgi:hypothetical protein